MAGSTTKKAIVRRFEKEALTGYVNPLSFLQLTGVELLSEDGNVSMVPYEEIKTISFVRGFDDAGGSGRRVFNTRPKMEGLWVSLEFRDGDAVRRGPRGDAHEAVLSRSAGADKLRTCLLLCCAAALPAE